MSWFYDLDCIIEKLTSCDLPSEKEVQLLCMKAVEILAEEPSLKKVSAPVTICGNICGQFFDLIELFNICGNVPETNYLFLGGYIDISYYSLETFLLLLALKVRYPIRITLLRGDKESRQESIYYGLYDECLRKYKNSNIWKLCTDSFECLPFAAVVEDKIFCVHGGLSPNITSIDEINLIQRRNALTNTDPVRDLLFGCPDKKIDDFYFMHKRFNAYLFGKNAVEKFNQRNKIDLIVRSHQLIMNGFDFMFDDKLLTIYSAPNHRYKCKNEGSVLECDDMMSKKIISFKAAPQNVRKCFSEITFPDYFY